MVLSAQLLVFDSMSSSAFIVLLSTYACIVSGQQRGDLRFRGSFSDGTNSGRLEVFMNNEWGTICIDGFTKRSADTACRQLGSFEALSFNEAETLGYGQGSGTIHITDVECSSNNIHILHCTVRSDRQCEHSSDVAVICSSVPAFQYDGGMRLLDGLHSSQGMLELYFFGQWGGVCGRTFDTITADAACIALGYTRSLDIRFVSRSENMNSPVWVTSASISCGTSARCFSDCYRDPTDGIDFSQSCSNNYVYLVCQFDEFINSGCLANPFDPNPNDGDTSVGGNVEDPEEADAETSGIIVGSIFGVIFIVVLIVCCVNFKGYKVITSCYENCCEYFASCLENLRSCFCGCLSILDIRRYFRNEDNENTAAPTGTYSPNEEPRSTINQEQPRSTINQELEELELAAMNELSGPRHSSRSSSSSDSEHSYKKESNAPPDYRDALKFRDTKASEKEEDVKPSSDDQPPPPSYDTVA